MGRLTEKIIMGLLALFLLVTVGYQFYIAFYGSMKTETVYEYTVSRAIPVEGIAIRLETPIEGWFQGVRNNVFDDGERVTVGQNVVEFYESDRSDRNLRRSLELEAEIAMLKSTQDISATSFTSTEIINRDIKEQLGYLTALAAQGRFNGSSDIKLKLNELVNKKQIATGTAKSFEPRIKELEAENESLGITESDNSVTHVKAPVSGYFVQYVDGYEDMISTVSVADYGIMDYLELLDGDEPVPEVNKVGKIVREQNWIFAAAASKSSLEFIRPGQELFVSFDTAGKRIPATVTKVMQDKDEERTVVLLACNNISGPLLELRKSGAVMNFNQYTGLRINMSDVRFSGEKRGVYIVDGSTVRFKLLDPIYEEQSFVLSRLLPPDSPEEEYVKLFDQIITKGNDLYDGKVIQ